MEDRNNIVFKKKAQLPFSKQDGTFPGGKDPIYPYNLLVRVDDNTDLKETEAYSLGLHI